MNAAFLLVTTTWLAAADAVPQAQGKPADQKPATTAPAPSPAPGQATTSGQPMTGRPGGPVYGPGPGPVAGPAWGGGCGSCGSCGSCCETSCCDEGCGHKWGGRLRGLFHRRSDCCDTGCDSCGGHHQWISGGHWGGSCGCDTGCGCDEGCGHKLFGRLHGLFNRHSDCCASDCCGGCSSCGGGYVGGYGAPIAAPGTMKAPEQIMTKPGEAKPMPSPGTGTAPGTEKRSELNPAPRLVPAPRTNLTVESTNPF